MTSEFELTPCEPEAVLPAQVSGGVRWDAETSGPRALMLAVLRRLVEDNGKLVTKAELLRAGWPDTHVTDGVLKVSILDPTDDTFVAS